MTTDELKQLLDIFDLVLVRTRYGVELEISMFNFWNVNVREGSKDERILLSELNQYYEVEKFVVLKTINFDAQEAKMGLKRVKGDLLEMAENGEFDIIVHGCNCFNSFGAGIAKQIKERFPRAYERDFNTVRGDRSKLGKMTFGSFGNLLIVNAYTQYGTSSKGEDVFEYDAFKQVLDNLHKNYREDRRFGFPLIGCGLAGGDKDRIIGMIEEFAKDRDVTLVEFGG